MKALSSKNYRMDFKANMKTGLIFRILPINLSKNPRRQTREIKLVLKTLKKIFIDPVITPFIIF